MPDPNPSISDALASFATKVGPGVLGSAIALRWMPEASTYLQRLSAFVGGVAAARYIAPTISEWSGVSGASSEGTIAFLCGAFSMVVIGTITETIKELQLAGIVRDAIRRFFRLDQG